MPHFEQYNASVTRVTLNSNTSGDTTLVTTPNANTKVRIVSCWIMANGAVNVKFGNVTANTYGGIMYLAANGGIVLPWNERGWFATGLGDSLKINLSGAVLIGGDLHYVLLNN